jgi:hypothetical protein
VQLVELGCLPLTALVQVLSGFNFDWIRVARPRPVFRLEFRGRIFCALGLLLSRWP